MKRKKTALKRMCDGENGVDVAGRDGGEHGSGDENTLEWRDLHRMAG